MAQQEGHPVGVANEYNVFAYRHHLPGGMMRIQRPEFTLALRRGAG